MQPLLLEDIDPVRALIERFHENDLPRREDKAITSLGYIANGDYGSTLDDLARNHPSVLEDAKIGKIYGLVQFAKVESELFRHEYTFTKFGKEFFHELVGAPL